MVKYVYNAWGSCKVFDAQGNDITYKENDETRAVYKNELGNLNPFRYRDYYYDVETGLYFLKTRYYDPEIGRFITIDDLQYLDPETINGLNLYAYCGNNPVMNVDPTGCFAILLLILGGAALIGGIIGGKIAYDKAVENGKEGVDLFWSTVGGIFLGASIGLAAGGLIVATAGAVVGAFAGLSAMVFGVTALQAFAIGALAFDFFAFIVAPIIGIKMEGIEMLSDKDKTKVPKPEETPRHPASSVGKNRMTFFQMNRKKCWSLYDRIQWRNFR